jgi:hypothetical protein
VFFGRLVEQHFFKFAKYLSFNLVRRGWLALASGKYTTPSVVLHASTIHIVDAGYSGDLLKQIKAASLEYHPYP